MLTAWVKGCFCNKDSLYLVPKKYHSQIIIVEDTLKALQQLASGWRSLHKDLKLIAITGSCGKTTTKEILKHILEKISPTLATKDNFNNEIGVPKTLLRIKAEHKFAIIELGARKIGDIKILTTIAKPDVCCCLNVGSAHLEIFGTLENTYKTKFEIIDFAPNKCRKIIFFDDPQLVQKAKQNKIKVSGFGKNTSSNVIIQKNNIVSHDLQEISLLINGKPVEFTLNTNNKSFAYNLAAACSILNELNIKPERYKDMLTDFSGISGRYKTHKINRLTLIDDSYNANYESMYNGLISLQERHDQQKLILFW